MLELMNEDSEQVKQAVEEEQYKARESQMEV